MSKLIDRLHELGRTEAAPIGFGARGPAPRVAAMLLIGDVTVAALKKNAAGKIRDGVDAILVDGIPDEKTASGLGDCIWGVRLRDSTEDALDKLRDTGCDFILVETDEAAALVLRDDGMARGFPITADLSEAQARALDELPFDYLALDYDVPSSKLSLDRLMKFQTAVSMVGKHILLQSRSCPAKVELELLRDLPVDAIVLDVASVGTRGMAAAKKAIDELEPRKPRGHRESPTIPQPGPEVVDAVEAPGHEDDDWDDEPDFLRSRG